MKYEATMVLAVVAEFKIALLAIWIERNRNSIQTVCFAEDAKRQGSLQNPVANSLMASFLVHHSVDVTSGASIGNNLAWISDYDRFWRYIEIHKSAGGYKGIVTDDDPSYHNRMGSDPDAVPNNRSTQAPAPTLRTNCRPVSNIYVRSDCCLWTDHNSSEMP
jgi:hypothetical protein